MHEKVCFSQSFLDLLVQGLNVQCFCCVMIFLNFLLYCCRTEEMSLEFSSPSFLQWRRFVQQLTTTNRVLTEVTCALLCCAFKRSGGSRKNQRGRLNLIEKFDRKLYKKTLGISCSGWKIFESLWIDNLI